MTDTKTIENKREYSAGIVLFTENGGFRKYLLLHYPSGHFDFPKGHLENNETEIQAAIRELEEETGITNSEIIHGYLEKIQYQFRHQGKIIEKEVTFFLGKTDIEVVTISHEHQASVWLPYNETHKQLTFQNAKTLLENAEKLLNSKNNK